MQHGGSGFSHFWEATALPGSIVLKGLMKRSGNPSLSTSKRATKRPKDKAEGLSDRRLKQYSAKGSKGKFPLTVGITGARAGDVLRGVEETSAGAAGDTANVVLRLVSGSVAAPAIIRRSVEAEVGLERLLSAVAQQFGISKAAAELRYNDFPSSEVPNHQPLGSGCSHGIEEDCQCPPAASFVIVSQGVWQSFAEQHGNGTELQHLGEGMRIFLPCKVSFVLQNPWRFHGIEQMRQMFHVF